MNAANRRPIPPKINTNHSKILFMPIPRAPIGARISAPTEFREPEACGITILPERGVLHSGWGNDKRPITKVGAYGEVHDHLAM